LKINRPDNLPEELGLTVMDEPTTKGVDKYILEMELAVCFMLSRYISSVCSRNSKANTVPITIANNRIDIVKYNVNLADILNFLVFLQLIFV
jgi:hypothetical protein